jgi:hypothetical protein
MSTRILQQWDPNTSYQLVSLEEDAEATAGELPISTISKNNKKSKKQQIIKNHSLTPAHLQIQFPTPQIFQDPPTFHSII